MPVKIKSAEFIKSSFERGHWPELGLPEVAFLGRSNVGKSSLLNSLLLRKGLARTSSTPGRTQSINFFLVNGSIVFADLPGYGYAKVPKTMRADWGRMAAEYLSDRKELMLSVHLIDARHSPTKLDLDLHEWLVHNGKPFIIAATKSDKLSANKLNKSLNEAGRMLAGGKVIAYSSETGAGRENLWRAINEAIENF